MLEAVKEKCNLTTRAENDTTALHLAAEFGNLEAVTWLVQQGLNFNERDKRGRTAEDYAINEGYREITSYLRQEALRQQNKVIWPNFSGKKAELSVNRQMKVIESEGLNS